MTVFKVMIMNIIFDIICFLVYFDRVLHWNRKLLNVI